MTSPSVRAPIFQLDSFTATRFAGNPAAVVVLGQFLSDGSMQAIAAENNLAETAFLVAAAAEHHLCWFTPTVEVKLCGHATLATAAVVMERLDPGREKVVFQSMSGPLTVERSGSRYVMDFRRARQNRSPYRQASPKRSGPSRSRSTSTASTT